MKSAVDMIMEKTKKHAKAREYTIQGANILKAAEKTISAALTSYPPAALAFSGLCATLPVNKCSVFY